MTDQPCKIHPFRPDRIDQALLDLCLPAIAARHGFTQRQLAVDGLPTEFFTTHLWFRLRGGEVLQFPYALLIRSLREDVVVVTRFSGLWRVRRESIADFRILEDAEKSEPPPPTDEPRVGIARTRRKRVPGKNKVVPLGKRDERKEK